MNTFEHHIDTCLCGPILPNESSAKGGSASVVQSCNCE